MDSPSTYDLYVHTYVNGSSMMDGVNFQESYAPVDHLESLHMILCLAASQCLTCHVLDISNTFQNPIIFDPSERVYITLPPWYLEFFQRKWPKFKLPSNQAKDLVFQCLHSIQGTKHAGLQWYQLLSGKFHILGMLHSTSNHGVFIWDF